MVRARPRRRLRFAPNGWRVIGFPAAMFARPLACPAGTGVLGRAKRKVHGGVSGREGDGAREDEYNGWYCLSGGRRGAGHGARCRCPRQGPSLVSNPLSSTPCYCHICVRDAADVGNGLGETHGPAGTGNTGAPGGSSRVSTASIPSEAGGGSRVPSRAGVRVRGVAAHKTRCPDLFRRRAYSLPAPASASGVFASSAVSLEPV